MASMFIVYNFIWTSKSGGDY